MSTNEALNRAVAEKIMGLYCGESGDAFWERIPDYCGDANLTMLVVKKMLETHTFQLTMDADSSMASFLADEPQVSVSREDTDWRRSTCLAALSARKHSTEGL